MRRAIVSLVLALTLFVLPYVNAQDANESIYPTLILYFSDGKNTTIEGKVWSGTVFPIVEGKIKGFDWTKKIKYLFFDKSLKGLNPYGLDFVRAMESHTYEEFENNFPKLVGDALNETYNLDSDGDGYTNYEELNAGTYPGDPKEHPGMNQEEFWAEYQGYIIIGVLIASIFVLYFVFNREKE